MQARAVAALVGHDPDPPRPALRSAGARALTGLLVAVLLTGLFAVYGLVTGHTLTAPTDPGVILQERESGARYVFRREDGRLHPILNYTSGLLLVGEDRPAIATMSARRLAEVPLGAPLGIPGAPDSLPAAADLLDGDWSVCTAVVDGRPRGTLLVGASPAGGTALSGGLLVHDARGRTHLIFSGHRVLLPAALTDASQASWPVAAAWLRAIPEAPAPPTVLPGLLPDPASACVTLSASTTAAGVRVNSTFPGGEAPGGAAPVDRIHIARGAGALVAAASTPDRKVSLVTDAGLRFPLAGPELLNRLGYPDEQPRPVPALLVAYLPSGPALDPVRAGRP
ncbi:MULTISPECIES: type VII secretion protein EccB [Actinoplanes]|uniref:type VII secretion protein EccB n=1 Tax=Actinoplanes TaxID=1865 RepID=UPI0006976D6B|nr:MULTISPECIES: type VII secretion protein EccB [Actinoplanes]GLY04967.1 hypothetical protein Acsp01_53460 [Actinoplanes sp. NBRC 101535]